jgi:transposase
LDAGWKHSCVETIGARFSIQKLKKVKEFVFSTNGILHISILPPHSPHLNTDEWVWNGLKNNKRGCASVPTNLERLSKNI